MSQPEIRKGIVNIEKEKPHAAHMDSYFEIQVSLPKEN